MVNAQAKHYKQSYELCGKMKIFDSCCYLVISNISNVSKIHFCLPICFYVFPADIFQMALSLKLVNHSPPVILYINHDWPFDA